MTISRSTTRAGRVIAVAIAALPFAGCVRGGGAAQSPREQASLGAAGREPTAQSRPTSPIPAPAPGAAGAVLSAEKWTYGQSQGQVIRTVHYRIYTTSENAVLRSRLPSFLEHALAHYRSAIIPLPPPPLRLDVYMMQNRPQWDRLTRQLMGDQAATLTQIPRGGYASRGIGVFYDIGLFDTMAIAAHESWHQYTQRVFKEMLPIWLEESLATYMEGHRWEGTTPLFVSWANVERFDQLRQAVSEGRLQSLEALIESRPQGFLGIGDDSVLTFYAQLWALSHFLLEGEGGKYASALRAIVADAAEGRMGRTVAVRLGDRAGVLARSGPGAFLAYFNEDLAGASREYATFVARLVEPGSRQRLVLGRSPFQQAASPTGTR